MQEQKIFSKNLEMLILQELSVNYITKWEEITKFQKKELKLLDMLNQNKKI